jgi:hypothetical protein
MERRERNAMIVDMILFKKTLINETVFSCVFKGVVIVMLESIVSASMILFPAFPSYLSINFVLPRYALTWSESIPFTVRA